MKNYIRIAAIAMLVVFMASCNQKELQTQKDEIALLAQENETLRLEAEEKQANLNEFFESMTQIRENLTEIKVRQNLITEETRDKENIGKDVRQQIQDDLTVISNLMEDNRKRLVSLNRQLRESNLKVTEFEGLIANLTKDTEDRNTEIAVLRDSMHELNISNENLVATIDKLEMENSERLNVIEQKTEQLNTAYYVYGTRRELQEQEIIDRTGGLLGMGRTTVVNSNLNENYFTRVDITSVDKVHLPGNNPRLVSKHPTGSYAVEENGEEGSEIIIENPEKFWSNTRYLVVSLD